MEATKKCLQKCLQPKNPAQAVDSIITYSLDIDRYGGMEAFLVGHIYA
jgi:hypothetical protein